MCGSEGPRGDDIPFCFCGFVRNCLRWTNSNVAQDLQPISQSFKTGLWVLPMDINTVNLLSFWFMLRKWQCASQIETSNVRRVPGQTPGVWTFETALLKFPIIWSKQKPFNKCPSLATNLTRTNVRYSLASHALRSVLKTYDETVTHCQIQFWKWSKTSSAKW